MNSWSQWVMEPVAIIVLLLLLVSFLQGMWRGASGSAKRLFLFVWETVALVAGLVLAGALAGKLSSPAADWLVKRVQIPDRELNDLEQVWYTLLTSVRDFALLRYVVLMLIAYLLIRSAATLIGSGFGSIASTVFQFDDPAEEGPSSRRGTGASRLVGAALGALLGAGRSFVFIAILFVYVTIMPSGWFAKEITQSPLYTKSSSWFTPLAGDLLTRQGPVLTEAVQTEFQQILHRKYEIIDYAIPADIEQAAHNITKDADTKEEKARSLYDWLGTRIAYDWDKANQYVEQGIWKEQTPPETFESRKGVCIDVARLYAVMARSAGLEVRVVTGRGADGRGGYGPHAWNEVLIGENDGEENWVPIDATWARSGDWFNPPQFDETHIREAFY